MCEHVTFYRLYAHLLMKFRFETNFTHFLQLYLNNCAEIRPTSCIFVVKEPLSKTYFYSTKAELKPRFEKKLEN